MKQTFTDPSTVEYWYDLYKKNNFLGEIYRQRKNVSVNFLPNLHLSGESLILDAGCGPGTFSQQAAIKGYRVFGIDNSYEMVKKAGYICNSKEKLNVSFMQGSIETLPFESSSFDVIVCLGVISYLSSEDKALNEFSRILKPGGLLIISIINKARLVSRLDPINSVFLIIKNILRKVVFWKKDGRNRISVHKTYLIPKFRKSLELIGFRKIKYRTIPSQNLTFLGREIFPQDIANNLIYFFEGFSNLPIVESVGGMCIFKAEKKHFNLKKV